MDVIRRSHELGLVFFYCNHLTPLQHHTDINYIYNAVYPGTPGIQVSLLASQGT